MIYVYNLWDLPSTGDLRGTVSSVHEQICTSHE